MNIDIVAGARPNFVKIAALLNAAHEQNSPIQFRLIHTGQHYDEELSGSFFKQLNLPTPEINLCVGSGSQAEQTGAIMIAYEKVLFKKKPDLCLVVGDVTSSMACAVSAKKLQVKVAHVEAGIRSNDWQMPEEVNRVIIDSIADFFFTTTREASNQLMKAGKQGAQIFFVGNTMIDTLIKFRPQFQKPSIWNKLKLTKSKYLVVTLHRPGTVDVKQNMKNILQEIVTSSQGLPIIFSVHPRTKKILKELEINAPNLHFSLPLSYLEFNYLVERAKAVITDSGGISEETTYFGIPCMTLRNSTERPETVIKGTNELLGIEPGAIALALGKLLNGKWKKGQIPELWDGHSGKRIIEILNSF